VRIVGEVDLARWDELVDLLQPPRPHPEVLVVDLAGTTFMDCTGVRLLARLDADARDQGYALRVSGAHHWVARLLRLTGLGDLLPPAPAQRTASEARAPVTAALSLPSPAPRR